MNIKPRGTRGVLWLEVSALESPTGQRMRVSLGTADRKLAQKKAREILDGERKTGRDMTLEKALTKAQRELWTDHKAQQFYDSSCNVLKAMLGGSTPLHRIDEDAIQVMVTKLRAKGNATSTINRRLAVLSRLLRAAHREWRVLGRVPYIPRLREPQGRTRTYTDQEQRLITVWCRQHDQELGRLVDFLFATGARVSEALNLDPEADLLPGPSVIFRDTKNGSPRTLPVTKQIAELVRAGRFEFRDSDEVAKRWSAMRTALGVTDREWVAHVVRHTVATRLLQAGWDVAKVKVWMGHRDIKTTMRYVHLVAEDLEAGAGVLDRKVALAAVS